MVMVYEDVKEGRIEQAIGMDGSLLSWYEDKNNLSPFVVSGQIDELHPLRDAYVEAGWNARLEIFDGYILALVIEKSFSDVYDGQTIQ